ncbi:MAG: hypothetical protein GF315_03590 [candidate division Zixibacteria bacterium]|nr:hypothetical protein [candidate division Zixibacteria bacterium]
MASKGKKKSSSKGRISRKQRAGSISSLSRRAFFVIIAVAILFVGTIILREDLIRLFNTLTADKPGFSSDYAALEDAIMETAVTFGINPDNIRVNFSDPAEDLTGASNDIRISHLYPKTLFHLKLRDNLAPTSFTIEDCIESRNGDIMTFQISHPDFRDYRFNLISDRSAKPQASYYSVIIDHVQSLSSEQRIRLADEGAFYAFILAPGVKGFTKTRQMLVSKQRQIIYEVPLVNSRFIKLMNAAASIVGLKRVKDLDQAMNTLRRLCRDFNYLYIRGKNRELSEELARKLGEAGFVIFINGEPEVDKVMEIFLQAGGRIIKATQRMEGDSRDKLRMEMLQYHREELLFNSWGIVTVEANAGLYENLNNSVNYLNRLNCKLTPVSQILLRIG